MGRTILPLLVLVLVGAAWLLLQEDSEVPAPRLPGASDPERGAAPPALRAVGTSPGEGERPAAPRQVQDPAGGAAHRVEGRVTGLNAETCRATTVTVHVLRKHDWIDRKIAPVSAPLEANGVFALDVGPLRAAHPDAARIRVTVDHPDYVPHKSAHDLAPLSEGRTLVPGSISLERGLIVRVAVERPDGSPAPSARVALYASDADGALLEQDYDALELDRATCDGEGRCRLRTARPGPVLVGAGRSGFVPAAARQVLGAEARTVDVTVRLRPAEPITGRVLLNGRPLAGATVRADIRSRPDELDMGWIGAWWLEGRVVARGGEAVTDAAGAFAFRGQDGAPRTLWVQAVEGHLLQRGGTWGRREVRPPARDVEIELAAAILDVQIVSGVRPLEGARLGVATRATELHGGGGGAPGGKARVLVRPEKRLVVTVEHADYETAERCVAPLAAGLSAPLVIDLGPPKVRSSLRVTLRAEDGSPVTSAGFVVTKDLDRALIQGFDGGLGLKRSASGVYVLDEQEPGTVVCAIYPGRSPDAYDAGDWLVAVERVQLVAGRETQLTVTARRGAIVEVAVRSEDGTPLEAIADLRDGRGRERSVFWYYVRERSATLTSGGPGPPPSRFVPPLPPDTYELRLAADGHASRTVTFRVAGGESKTIEVTLEKR